MATVFTAKEDELTENLYLRMPNSILPPTFYNHIFTQLQENDYNYIIFEIENSPHTKLRWKTFNP